jgi:hypothetical protein
MCRATKDDMQRPSQTSSKVSCPGATVLALAVGAASMLAACVAVPVDLRTGQPIAWPAPAPTASSGEVSRVAPPAPLAPPAPTIYTARLYPINEIGNRAGMLTATVTDGHGGRSTFSLTYLGDAMQGEASRVEPNYPGFGRILRDALGTTQGAALQGPRGIATAAGPRGVSAQCEDELTGPSKGTGACVFSDGARYQMHFG